MAGRGTTSGSEVPPQPAPPAEEAEAGDIEEFRVEAPVNDNESLAAEPEKSQTHFDKSSSVLTTDIEESLVHGVPLITLFQGFGEAFKDHTFVVGDYEKSQEVCQLHEFISHDWFSGRVAKFLALCLLYNSWPAVVISGTLAVVLGIGQVCHLLPYPTPSGSSSHDVPHKIEIIHCYGCWCQLLCPPVFFLVLLWWQHFPHAPYRDSRMVFFDKHCIDQGNDERKRAGILGLGGFIKRSDRLVILWTPRYFTRLWCAFEVASWLHLQKSSDSVIFLPLSHAAVTVVCTFAASVLMLVYGCSFFLCSGVWNGALLTGVIALGFPFPAHYMRYSVHEISRFPQRLEEFSITKADCFCCANNHRLPSDSSVTIPCDRVLVELTVREWFSRQAAALETESLASLESFDHEFRDLFGKFASKRAGLAHLPYKYALLYLFPVFFRGCDALSVFGKVPTEQAIRKLLEFPVVVFLTGPCVVGLIFRLVALVDKVAGLPKRRCLDLLATLVTAQLCVIVFLLLWVPPNTACSQKSVWPFVAVSVVEACLAIALYRKDLWRLFLGMPAPTGWCRHCSTTKTSGGCL